MRLDEARAHVQRALEGALPNVTPGSMAWRERASKLQDKIAEKQSEIRALMTIGAPLELHTARGTRWTTPRGDIATTARARKQAGADKAQAKAERELAQLERLYQLAVQRYQRLERLR